MEIEIEKETGKDSDSELFIYLFIFYCLGERTFGVLTKLDLMDKGTNALDVSFCFA